MKPLTLFSHRIGPNPWKNVTILNELGIEYETIFRDFGNGVNGVEGSEFIKLNPAGRVPLLRDPNNGDLQIAESNNITQYLIDKYDKEKRLVVTSEHDKYVMNQWLLFQSASQGPFFAQALIFKTSKNDPEGTAHFQGLVKRTIKSVDTALAGKTYLVGDKCTIADLAYINWDLTLDMSMAGDPEAATKEQRAKLWPNWAAWHARLLERPAVQKMVQAYMAAQQGS